MRSAFVLLLLLTLCAIPFALAQSRSHGAAKQSVAKPTVSSGRASGTPRTPILPAPKLPAVTLYDQLNNPGTSSTSSQEFPDVPTYTDFAADDFIVPSGQTWNVTEVDAQGVYFNGPGPADNFNVFFYQNNSGVPGTQVYSATAQSYVNNSGVFQVTLTAPAVLPSGEYWLSVQAHMSDSPNGQWGWTDRAVQANSPAVWQNPGGGFGVCPTWAARTTCVGDAPAPDQMFRLIGTMGTQGGAVRYDFNGDGYPDLVLYNESTGQTELMYMQNNVQIGTAFGPTLPPGWSLIDEDDFNGDGHPDYLLFNSSTGQTAIVYMNNNVVIGAALGPTLPLGWQLIAAGDFNGDGEPDYVVCYPSAHVTVLAYMNNNVFVGVAVGPTIPAGFSLIGLADFNGDGNIDYLLFNPTTGQTEILYLNNNVVIGSAYGPTIPGGYSLAATADFNRDGHPDYLIDPPLATWMGYLNGTTVIGVAPGPPLAAGFRFANGAAQFFQSCSYSISPPGAAFTSAGGAGIITVSANAGCPWTATTGNPDFIHITSGYTGNGPGVINYTVDAYTGSDQRSGSISIGSENIVESIFNITQSGTGTNWDGTWVGTVSGTFSAGNCSWNGTATFTMTISTNGSSVTGNGAFNGFPCWQLTDCSIADYVNSSGSVNGTTSGATININYSGTIPNGGCSGQSTHLSFTGTLTGTTISGTATRGWQVRLTKQ